MASPRKYAARGIFVILFSHLLQTAIVAQAYVPLKGNGSITTAYQYANVHDHFYGDGVRYQKGRIYSDGLLFQTDYGITDRMAVSFSVPYLQSRYSGVNPHNPANLTFPNNVQLLDDGYYHGGFQDLGFGFRYNLEARPVLITPFVSYSMPSHEYTFFAHSALGQDLHRLVFGLNIGGQFDRIIPNSYFHVRYGYAIPEKVKIFGNTYGGNQSLLRGDFGHALTARFSLRAVQILQIAHGGLMQSNPNAVPMQPNDYPEKNELWFHHDQIDAISSWDAGGAFDLNLTPSIEMQASLVHTFWGRNGHALRMGIVAGITYSFPKHNINAVPSLAPAGHVH